MTVVIDAWDHAGDRVRAKRAAARSLHPDVGGDAETFSEVLAAIDRRFGTRPGADGEQVEITILRTPRGRVQARVRALTAVLRRNRHRLPLPRRRFPS